MEAAAGESALVRAGSAPTKSPMTEEEAGLPGWPVGIAVPRLELDLDLHSEVAADAQTVTVSGTSEPGAQVTINGRSVDLDAQHRFTLDVPFPQDQSVLQVIVVARDQRGYGVSRPLLVSRSK